MTWVEPLPDFDLPTFPEGKSDESEVGPALDQISFAPICKVLSFTDNKETMRAIFYAKNV
ncbi:MAG: hypothetical protein AB7S50_01810 [Bacteroidales bacterium]